MQAAVVVHEKRELAVLAAHIGLGHIENTLRVFEENIHLKDLSARPRPV